MHPPLAFLRRFLVLDRLLEVIRATALTASLAVSVLAAGCGEDDLPPDDTGPRVSFKVMTRNLYLGSELMSIVLVPTADRIPPQAASFLATVQASDPGGPDARAGGGDRRAHPGPGGAAGGGAVPHPDAQQLQPGRPGRARRQRAAVRLPGAAAGDAGRARSDVRGRRTPPERRRAARGHPRGRPDGRAADRSRRDPGEERDRVHGWALVLCTRITCHLSWGARCR